ncbi:MAG: hypothetical protein LW845_16365, partial [Flammeovirgaceae bacterium]|nr:hypothetical protein [Flammeovirgaceae bacterium]
TEKSFFLPKNKNISAQFLVLGVKTRKSGKRGRESGKRQGYPLENRLLGSHNGTPVVPIWDFFMLDSLFWAQKECWHGGGAMD